MSAQVDERTQYELYYPPFEGAIEADVGSVMCSYNRIRGTYSCENPETLQRDLKDRLGYKGWVMSDWGATHSMSLAAGLDQEFPTKGWMKLDNVNQSLSDGSLTMKRVDDGAARILMPLFKVGAFDVMNNNTDRHANTSTVEHQALARSLAAKSLVLLKNDNGTLPLNDSAESLKVAIIGKDAMQPVTGGGGSGSTEGTYYPPPHDMLVARLKRTATTNCSGGQYDTGYDYTDAEGQSQADAGSIDECCALCAARTQLCNYFTFVADQKTCWMKESYRTRQESAGATSGMCRPQPLPPSPPGCDATGNVCVFYNDGSDVASAAKLAATADIAIVFVSAMSGEGGDRESLSFENNADQLIAAVAAGGVQKTVVAAVAPGAALTPWRDSVSAIVYGIFPGQEYGNAVMDIIFGDVNPSAKLPITLPNVENEVNFTQSQYPGPGAGPDPDRPVATYSQRCLLYYKVQLDASMREATFPEPGGRCASISQAQIICPPAAARHSQLASGCGRREDHEQLPRRADGPCSPELQVRVGSLEAAGEALNQPLLLVARQLRPCQGEPQELAVLVHAAAHRSPLRVCRDSIRDDELRDSPRRHLLRSHRVTLPPLRPPLQTWLGPIARLLPSGLRRLRVHPFAIPRQHHLGQHGSALSHSFPRGRRRRRRSHRLECQRGEPVAEALLQSLDRPPQGLVQLLPSQVGCC